MMKKLILFLALPLALSLTSCNGGGAEAESQQVPLAAPTNLPGPGKVEHIDATGLHSWMENGSKPFQVLDVRTPEEFATGSLRGAKNIDFLAGDFKEKANSLDRNATWVVICQVGRRSATASQQLADLGFPTVWALDGGLDGWAAAGYELVK